MRRSAADEVQRKVDEVVTAGREESVELWAQIDRLNSLIRRAERTR